MGEKKKDEHVVFVTIYKLRNCETEKKNYKKHIYPSIFNQCSFLMVLSSTVCVCIHHCLTCKVIYRNVYLVLPKCGCCCLDPINSPQIDGMITLVMHSLASHSFI